MSSPYGAAPLALLPRGRRRTSFWTGGCETPYLSPPLSQQIRRLEKELQAPLFHRTTRHVELTNAGRVFLGEARAGVAQAEQAAGTVQRASRGEMGQLVVGCALWADFLNGAKIIRLFAQRHPDVEVELRDLTAPEQISALEDRSIHVGILRPPVPSNALMSERLCRRAWSWRSREGTGSRTTNEFPGKPPSISPMSSSRTGERRPTRPSLPRACRDAGMTLRVKYEVEHPQTVLAIVATGLGISLVPASLQMLKRPGIAYRRLRPTGPALDTVIAWRRDSELPFVQAFVRVAGKSRVRALSSLSGFLALSVVGGNGKLHGLLRGVALVENLIYRDTLIQ